MTSVTVTTFEQSFRQRLLDIVYGQWSTLGAPFAERTPSDPHEVIDPEALLWCSLEFLPTEPRLAEAVLDWLANNGEYIVRQRVYRRSRHADPRALVWSALDPRSLKPPRAHSDPPAEASRGLNTDDQVVDFARRAAQHRLRRHSSKHRVGHSQSGPATLLLRARDLIGQDIRHFLLVYLLANPHGGKLREVREWSGYSYRSLSEAASRWVTAEVVTIDSGHCRLVDPEPWRDLLHIETPRIIPVRWLNVFETSVRLLRNLAKARAKGIGEDGPVRAGLKREAAEQLTSSLAAQTRATDSSIDYLLRSFAAAE